jgi:hypothetical protein
MVTGWVFCWPVTLALASAPSIMMASEKEPDGIQGSFVGFFFRLS